MKIDIKKLWPYLVALVVFVVVACVYMSPVLEGKIIATSDGVQGRAAVHEAAEYAEQTGDRSWWTGSMFSGMPNYQIGGGQYLADVWKAPIRNVLLWGHRNVIAIVLIYCIGFFVLLRSLKVDKWLSIVGALAIAFSSYFFIIIGANHHGKTSTLALMSMVAAGLYLIFNGHRRVGVVLTMVCSAIGFFPHPQMSYYVCFIVGAFWLAELYNAFVSKVWKVFAINTVLFGAAFGIGLGTGTAATFANLEYAEQTMRGGHSDLESSDDSTNKTKGLDLDYATAWSYGIDECWTFLIPNYMGGSSNYQLGADSQLCKDMVKQGVPRRQAEQFCQSAPTYWGDQPFTAGPVYMGVLVVLLFLLGIMIVKGPYKWALLAVTILTICLSWGNHWMWFTRLFFDYVPMYNKFRAVSSILVVAEITMPVLAFLALQEIVKVKTRVMESAQSAAQYTENSEVKSLGRKVLIAAGVVVGLLLVALVSTDGFVSKVDAQLPEWLIPMLRDARASMFRSDVWRAIGIACFSAIVLYFYVSSHKFKSTGVLALVLGAIVLFDMWPIDKRYMNDSFFSPANSYEKNFKPTSWERQLMEDKDPNYRVYNLTMNPFNDARTSYRLKSIGGYSAAKLRRYQDLIDQHLSKMHMPVLNMLNTKYVIVNHEGKAMVQRNYDAMGNAWFVKDVVVANTPNEECDGLMQVDLRKTAIVGVDYSEYVEPIQLDSTAEIHLTSYRPNQLTYEASCATPGTVVFSEIFYPYGWNAYVDDVEVPHYRVNYMLRALNLKPGHHTIRFEFAPESVKKGNLLSMVFVVLMYAVILGCIVLGVRDMLKSTKA